MEGPHGQLGAGFADGLCGDDADRLADVHRCTPGQVATVAGAADAKLGLTGQDRTHLHGLDSGGLDDLDHVLIEIGVCRDDDFAAGGIAHILCGVTPQYPCAEGDKHVAALNHRPEGDATAGAAIFLVDDAVLGDVDEAASQVARVGRLQRGVGQALTGPVGGVEVLLDRQAFFEVRDDRGLDDLTRGLGHEAAHSAQLLHLGLGATGTRVGHHEDRVDLPFPTRGVFLGGGNLRHHLVSDAIGGLGPGVDNLVVLLALGNEAVRVLLLVFLDQPAGFLDDRLFPLRDDDVILAEGDAGLGGLAKA